MNIHKTAQYNTQNYIIPFLSLVLCGSTFTYSHLLLGDVAC